MLDTPTPDELCHWRTAMQHTLAQAAAQQCRWVAYQTKDTEVRELRLEQAYDALASVPRVHKGNL